MLGINFSELLLIAVVALVVIGPKELPTVIRHLAAIIREVRAFIGGARAQFHQAAREAGFEDILDGTSTIIDLDGKPQQAYDVRELKTLAAPVEPAPKPLGVAPEKSEHE